MKVLLLGGTGFIGRAIAQRFSRLQDVEAVIGARNPASPVAGSFVRVDATDVDALTPVLAGTDVVVNCVTGSAETIRKSAAAIVDAAGRAENSARIVHMSSMAVYGGQQGNLSETDPVSDDGNWYGRAKIEAENIFRNLGDQSGATILRIGCVYGRGSLLWVDRIGLLLRSGRLGDLAEQGDGWSNLVHVDDVAEAVVLSIRSSKRGTTIYNLAGPDSPRWNSYFRDFALAADWVPLKYKSRLSMVLESNLIAPPLKIWERLSARGWLKTPGVQSIPPSLLRLWSQQIKLESAKVERELGLKWTPYDEGLRDSVNYFRTKYG